MSLASEALRLRALGFHPICERPNSKMPASAAWQTQVNREPAEIAEEFARNAGCGIGTVTHGFIVIDLDVRPDKDGPASLVALENKHGALPVTLASKTPSGGRHLFFRVDSGVEVRNSVSKLGPGIDVRGTGGQVVLPPTVIDGKPYAWVVPPPMQMAELPEAWLRLLTGAPTNSPKVKAVNSPGKARTVRSARDAAMEAERRAHYMATLSEPSIQGAGGNTVMMNAAWKAKACSRNTGEALASLLEWNERLASPPWSEAELLRAIQNSEARFGEILDTDRPAPQSGLSEESARTAEADIAWVESMQRYVARDRRTRTWNLGNPLSDKGAIAALVARGLSAADAKEALSEFKITNAYSVECDPTEGPTFERDGLLILNNYVRATLKPKAGSFPVIGEVLTFLTGGDLKAREWLVNWLAFAVQNPARQMRTVPVLFGAQGTGKSLIARAMQTLLGELNSATIRNEDIKSKFTSHFVSKLFLVVGEIEAGEVAHATSTLKYLTGEPVLVHEAKGATPFQVTNRIKMMATSNQTLPVTLEGDADSRWVLFKQMTPPPADYSARMSSLFDQATNAWNEKGRSELAAFLDYLLKLNVDVQLARTVHKNDARASAVEASRSSIEQFVESVNGSSLDAVWVANVQDYQRSSSHFDHMDFPGYDHLTGATAVYATYRAFCLSSGLLALGTGRFYAEIDRHAQEWKRVRANASISPARPFCYTGIPRERRLRLSYLPLEMRQGAMKFTPAAKPAEKPALKPVPPGLAAIASLFPDAEVINGD